MLAVRLAQSQREIQKRRILGDQVCFLGVGKAEPCTTASAGENEIQGQTGSLGEVGGGGTLRNRRNQAKYCPCVGQQTLLAHLCRSGRRRWTAGGSVR